tara:strand:+ start:277 stop:504 length:228 start_codon:yes stop_codon:yes gene_type:complete
MKLSKRIKNPLLSIEVILEEGVKASNYAKSDKMEVYANSHVVISRLDACRILQWIKELKDEEIATLSLIETVLNN